MKSLVPWVCLFATASQTAMADNFSAYRLGNYDKATQQLLAESGKNPVADYYLGRIYLYGYGQLKNTQLALRYFTQSAEKGYLPAMQILARYALIHDKNPEQALVWFKKAAAAGDVDAQMYMAAAYLYGIGVKKSADMATRYYIDAAKNGNGVAQYTLAQNFINSKHAANKKLGMLWLNKAVANNNPQAQMLAGEMYLEGKGYEKNPDKGMALLTQAAEQGYAPAMVRLGKLDLASNEKDKAFTWFDKAGASKNPAAYLELASLYFDTKSSIHDPKMGFMWTLKAAQNGSQTAKRQLAELYQKGMGVDADTNLAKQWLDLANQEEKNNSPGKGLAEATLWLSNGATAHLEQTAAYQMRGIFTAWKNPAVLGDFAYNQSPQLKTINRQQIFQPQFSLVQPNTVPINQFYEALMAHKDEDNQWTYPVYTPNRLVAEVLRMNSPVVAHRELPAPYLDAYYPVDDTEANVMDIWTEGWQRQVNTMAVFHHLYNRAILGDAQAQFEIGQMFQYGIGVTPNDESAIVFYQNAVQQQHLGAEYNLGVLYLKRAKTKQDYQLALDELMDAAFKGNKNSQYVLAHVLEKGITSSEGVELIKADPQQANAMLYLAAANDYGPAEYTLANRLAMAPDDGSMQEKQQKNKLIRELYQGAAHRGIANALLPLAFYDAMDVDNKRQQRAFTTAKELAEAGNEKAALLLGLLLDRGIGTGADNNQAIQWYQKAGDNAPSQFILGTYAAEGKGLTQNKDKAMAQLQQAATEKFSYADFNMAVLQKESGQEFLPDLVHAYELGNNHAGLVLADYYLSANTDAEKMKQAREIYQGLAAKGDAAAQLKLAYMDAQGLGSAVDMSSAQRWYTAAAEQGNPTAQYQLAQFYQIGASGEPNYEQAKSWYEKAAAVYPEAWVALGFIEETVNDNYAQALKDYEMAAQKNDPLGTYNLALMYFYGKGTAVDYAKARELFLAAADKIPDAMSQLGEIYFMGLGVPRDEKQALSWYKKAADAGDPQALYELGLMSETGVSTTLDFAQAVKYYQAAADKNNEKAMLALARMYQYGLGVTKDPKISAQYYQQLAARQNAYAQYQLGNYYLEGTAGERSAAKAKQWLQQASDNGNVQARKMLQRLEAQTQSRVSFIEPLVLDRAPIVAGEAANLLYLDALNEWNRGDEVNSRRILKHLVTQYPDFVPAQQAFEQMNQALENPLS